MWSERSLKRKITQKPLLICSSFTDKENVINPTLHVFNMPIMLRSSGNRSKQRLWCEAPHQVKEPNTDSSCKRVAFHAQVTIHYTISRHDILPEEQADSWFSDDEYDDIAKSCIAEIQKLNRGQHLKDKKYCARGLESETKVGMRTKRMYRCLAQRTVTEEQDRQRREGVREPDRLAYLYHSATSSSQVWANAVGLADQRAAEDLMEIMSTGKDNCSSRQSSWDCPSLTRSSLVVVQSAESRSRGRSSELARAA